MSPSAGWGPGDRDWLTAEQQDDGGGLHDWSWRAPAMSPGLCPCLIYHRPRVSGHKNTRPDHVCTGPARRQARTLPQPPRWRCYRPFLSPVRPPSERAVICRWNPDTSLLRFITGWKLFWGFWYVRSWNSLTIRLYMIVYISPEKSFRAWWYMSYYAKW